LAELKSQKGLPYGEKNCADIVKNKREIKGQRNLFIEICANVA